MNSWIQSNSLNVKYLDEGQLDPKPEFFGTELTSLNTPYLPLHYILAVTSTLWASFFMLPDLEGSQTFEEVWKQESLDWKV